ncbi:hypothetical protein QFZ42_004735 [Variovorax paradoxus]|jgi:hypothetical protein|uniref:hypothetical protein n=1 Tax=Variovorax paradoxus TaxID=34073 RepID=UPI002790C4FF|nr:hypothetical protein [Variovorax paradoxus]MDQ0572901.1 hypothetical protein [Variovorax paradoxus]
MSMSESERIALAARLHVALRRKHGRVTDTEWMATNAEYATEIVRMTRAHAAETKDEDLYLLATRLEQAMEPLARAARLAARAADGNAPNPLQRYIGKLR